MTLKQVERDIPHYDKPKMKLTVTPELAKEMGWKMKPREPKFKGMTVLEVGYIDIADIDAFARKNKSRRKGIISASVIKFETLIINDTYEPLYFIPPVVIRLKNGKYELVAGEHRLHAHMGLGKTKIWVAIVKFESRRTKFIYQSVENKLDFSYVSTPRKFEDLVYSAVNILKEEGFVGDNFPTPNHVATVVNELQISTQEATKSSIREAVRLDIGTTKVDIQTYSAATGKSTAEKIHGNNPIDMSAVMYKGVGGETKDTDIRLFFQMLKKKVSKKDPALPYYVYAHWQDIDGEDLPTARKNKPEFWTTIEDNIVDFAKVIQSPDYVSPVLKTLPQIDGDDD